MDIRYDSKHQEHTLYIDNQEIACIEYDGIGFNLHIAKKPFRGKDLYFILRKVEDALPFGRSGSSFGDSKIWYSNFTVLGFKKMDNSKMNTIFKYVQDLAVNQNFKERVYKAQQRKLMENIDNSLIGEIKEIYRDYVSDLSTTKAEGLITISFTISGAGTSFEEVEGDMNNIAESYDMVVSDFSSFCNDGQDIECDEYLRTGQPVEFCVSFEHIN